MAGAQPASLRARSPNDRRSSMLSSRAQDDASGLPVFVRLRARQLLLTTLGIAAEALDSVALLGGHGRERSGSGHAPEAHPSRIDENPRPGRQRRLLPCRTAGASPRLPENRSPLPAHLMSLMPPGSIAKQCRMDAEGDGVAKSRRKKKQDRVQAESKRAEQARKKARAEAGRRQAENVRRMLDPRVPPEEVAALVAESGPPDTPAPG